MMRPCTTAQVRLIIDPSSVLSSRSLLVRPSRIKITNQLFTYELPCLSMALTKPGLPGYCQCGSVEVRVREPGSPDFSLPATLTITHLPSFQWTFQFISSEWTWSVSFGLSLYLYAVLILTWPIYCFCHVFKPYLFHSHTLCFTTISVIKLHFLKILTILLVTKYLSKQNACCCGSGWLYLCECFIFQYLVWGINIGLMYSKYTLQVLIYVFFQASA